MPHPSQRRDFFRDAAQALPVLLLDETVEEELAIAEGRDPYDYSEEDLLLGSDMDNLLEALAVAQASRYVAPRIRLGKTKAYDVDIFPTLNEVDFRQQVRMNRASFAAVCGRIENDPVFQNDSYIPQEQVSVQLACALERFGKYGTGASLGALKRIYGIGAGTVAKYTERVITALNNIAGDLCPSVPEPAANLTGIGNSDIR